MDAEQANLLHSYTEGEEVDISKLRTHLQKTSAADRWSALKVQSVAIHRAAYYNDVETAKCMLKDFEPGQVYDILKVTGSFKGIENTPLHIAANKGHSEMVNFLLKSLPGRKLDLVKLQNKEGETPLHAAVKSYKSEAMELLLSTLTKDQRYEVLNVKNKRNETVLHTAIHKGLSYTVETILKSVPNMKLDLPESLDSRGANTALHAAVDINNMKMVQLILLPLTEDQRYEVLVQESYLGTVLHVAASKGHTNIVKYILESVPSKQLDLLKLQDRKEETVLQAAVDANNKEMVKLILSTLTDEQRYEVLNVKNGKGEGPLHTAASRGHINILNYILESVPSKMVNWSELLDSRGASGVLHAAVDANDMNMVQLVLSTLTEDQRYKVLKERNNQGEAVLHAAAFKGRSNIVKYVLESVDNKRLDLLMLQTENLQRYSSFEIGDTALHAAVKAKKEKTIELILSTLTEDQRYKVLDVKNSRYETVLHMAASKGHTDMVKCIIKSVPNKRLDLSKLQHWSASTVLHAAVDVNNAEMIQTALSTLTEDQRYEVVTQRHLWTQSMLHIAASRGHTNIVKCILESVSNKQMDLLKLQAREGKAVLQAAVGANKMEMVQCILSALSEQQRYEILKQQSVLHIAASKGHTNTVKCILESIPNKKLNLLKIQNERRGTVLYAAMDANMVEMVQVILSTLSEDQRYEALKAANRQGVTVLHTAATEGRTIIVKSILESVPNKMLDLLKLRCGQERNTPLHTAAIEKKSETVLTILQVVTPDGLKELQDIKNSQNQSIADLAAPELYYHYTTQELAVLKKSSEEKDTVIAGQAEEIDDNSQKLAAVERQLRDDLAKQTEDNTEQIKQVQLEKQQQDKDLTALKEKQILQETTVNRQVEELAVLKKSGEKKDTVIAGQAEEIDDNRQKLTAVERQFRDSLAKQREDNTKQIKQVQLEKQQQDKALTALKEKQIRQEATVKRQAEELAVLKESTEQKDTVIAAQAVELQQLRHNQTEMLSMIEALEIYLGKPTSDQENETDNDN